MMTDTFQTEPYDQYDHYECNRCALRGAPAPVPGRGNWQAKIMLVGEAPGAEEVVAQQPFVGRAGQLLRGLMAEVELDPSGCFFSNLVHCRPPGNDFAKALEAGAAVCRTHWLYRELQAIQPRVIVAVGARAGRVLLNTPERWTATELATMTYEDPLNKCLVVGCFHPSFALRSGETFEKQGAVCRSIKRSLITARKAAYDG